MLYALIAIGALLLCLIVTVIIRTLLFKPKEKTVADESEISFDTDACISRLCSLVKCKTVSYKDPSLEDDREFQKLIDMLPSLYPNVFDKCTFFMFPDRGLLFKWEGRSHESPAVMMAHYDVVPVNEDQWDKPAFEAIIEDGVIWGRGTLDTKVTFNGILSAAEHLIGEGFTPENDIYFAFSGGEEINGLGAVHIVDFFEKNGIKLAFVVDEGGAVVENVFPGVKEPCGLIGIAEKGMMNVKYTAKSQGGHASAPKPGSPLVALSRAVTSIEDHPFKSHITPPVAKLFDSLGRHSTFLYRMIFANLWLFSPVLDLICKKSGGELNALMRTTVAFTQSSGSFAANVIPPEAAVISNIRLNPADNMEKALKYLKKTVDNEKVEITVLDGMNPSRISRTDCPEYEKVAMAVSSTWGGCITAPYLMVQCSDSRHYGRISDRVYRFSAMDLTSEERATIHGNNERIRKETALRSVEFYIRLMSQC
ncbi:MAG: M20/M25/M40 family metallo-hydrolase [Ruminococcaceae bacterium]|nr:M20/M25/M40 family metallo-hydrolase [Oscillospiraceae bacterium]